MSFNLAINFLAFVFLKLLNTLVYQMLFEGIYYPAEFLINKLNLFWTCISYLHESYFNFENYTLTDIKVQKKNNIK